MEIKILFSPTHVNYDVISKNKFILKENYNCVWSYKDNSGERKTVDLVIPAGYEWDGASIPRILWTAWGYYPAGIMLSSSLTHDYLYTNRQDILGHEITRLHADGLFYLDIVSKQVEPKIAIKMYRGIRLFGWFYWKGYYRKIKSFLNKKK
jgi:hypothetical protein